MRVIGFVPEEPGLAGRCREKDAWKLHGREENELQRQQGPECAGLKH